jgi:drug/metabolite transporter (DMT)-like permease
VGLTEVRPYFWMLGGCGWFTLMSLCAVALAHDGCPWQIVAAARSGLATLFAFGIAVSRKTPLTLVGTRTLWIRSVAGSCSMLGAFYALRYIPASDVLTLTNTFPLWVAVLSWPLMGERPTLGVLAAVSCAILGVAVAQRPGSMGFELGPSVCALVSALFTAIAMLGLNRLRGVAALAVVVHFSAVSTGFALLAMLVFPFNVHETPTEPHDWALLLGVGATATAGQVCLTRAFSTGHATNVAVVSLSQVVMVMVCEAMLGWKRFDEWNLLGTLLVIGPTAWIMARRTRRARPVVVTASPTPEVTSPNA